MDQQLLQLKEDNDSDGPVALVSSNGRYRGFSKNRQISGFDCSVPGVYDFPAAQPAFVNSAAMRVLRSALDANGLTELQKIWGGSHDVNLGMLFWLYRIPLLSFFDAYVSVEIENETPPPGTVDASKAIVFHKVRHYQKKQAGAKAGRSKVKAKGERAGMGTEKAAATAAAWVAGQHQIASILNESLLYPHPSSFSSSKSKSGSTSKRPQRSEIEFEKIRKWHFEIAAKGFEMLSPLLPSGVLNTSFADRARRLQQQFSVFLPRDCKLLLP